MVVVVPVGFGQRFIVLLVKEHGLFGPLAVHAADEELDQARLRNIARQVVQVDGRRSGERLDRARRVTQVHHQIPGQVGQGHPVADDMVAEHDQLGELWRLDQDKADGRPGFEFKGRPGRLGMDFDPVLPGFPGDDRDGSLLDPFGGKPQGMVRAGFDADAEQGVPLPDLGYRTPEHLLRDMALDAQDHSDNGKRRPGEESLRRRDLSLDLLDALIL